MTGIEAIEAGERPIYEERVTLWRAGSHDEAMALAEADALVYADTLGPHEYLGLAQSYELPEAPAHGSEVFSLLRESDLAAEAYLDRFYDTGDERQSHVDDTA